MDPIFYIRKCVDFTAFQDGYSPGYSWPLNGFQFTVLANPSSLGPMIVLGSGYNTALRFPPEGLEITLPEAADVVALRLKTGGSGLIAEAFDANARLLGTAVFPHSQKFVRKSLRGSQITSVRLWHGSNEAYLAEICIFIPTDDLAEELE